MNNSVVLFGAGGHARSLISLVNTSGLKISGIYDESYTSDVREEIYSIRVIGTITDYKGFEKIILSIGDNKKRRGYFLSYRPNLYRNSIIHPTSQIDSTAKIGDFNNIFANTVLNSSVSVRENNIINTGAIIEHEVIIGSHNHISVGAIICGRSSLGDCCYIGAGAVIIDKVEICSNVTIGANAVVITSIDQPGVYVGNPAKRIK